MAVREKTKGRVEGTMIVDDKRISYQVIISPRELGTVNKIVFPIIGYSNLTEEEQKTFEEKIYGIYGKENVSFLMA